MTAPRVLAPDFDAVPAPLRERRQWVLWRLQHKSGAKKPTKVPCQPGGALASSVDPATWRPFEDVRAAYEAGGFDGVGYVFTPDDPFVGIDLDGCRDAGTGELAPWARTALDRFTTYAEVSPSGTGIHLIMEGALPPGGRKRGPVECYEEGRYFTVTGRSPDGAPERAIEERWEVLAAWHAEAFPPKAGPARHAAPEPAKPAEPDDERLLERARKAKNGRKFRALFDDGDTSGYGSHSEADLGLCVLLAFWTRGDAARVDRLFRRSKLVRPKWDQNAGQGETYGQRTVRTAIERSAPAPDAATGELCTDLGNARRLVHLHGRDLRHTGALGWLVWDGRRWCRDETGESERRAKDAVRSIRAEVRKLKDAGNAAAAEHLWKWAVKSQGAARIEALLKLARTEPEIAARDEDFDRDAWLLNVQNGTLDLRAGELREHRREDLLTKLVPVAYEAGAEAPRWLRFLEQVQPDHEARGFLARYAGYCLTGDMGEQVFAVHHGGGSNGKGVYSDTLLAMLGDYAGVTPYATFVQRRPDAPTNDLAALRGARLVVASEPNEGVRLDEGAVKSITGEDPISARFHYREFFTFRPTCKLILTGNHRPRIRGTDHAMWRRVLLVPWPVTVSKPDKDLRRRLRDELPGILRWAVEGCLLWQREGLRPPATVRAAVDEYREAEDHVGRFIGDRCRLGSELVVTAKELRAAYVAWVEEDGEEAMSAKALGSRLTDRGIRAVKDVAGVRGRGWQGIALATHATDPTGSTGSPPYAHARARAGGPFPPKRRSVASVATGSGRRVRRGRARGRPGGGRRRPARAHVPDLRADRPARGGRRGVPGLPGVPRGPRWPGTGVVLSPARRPPTHSQAARRGQILGLRGRQKALEGAPDQSPDATRPVGSPPAGRRLTMATKRTKKAASKKAAKSTPKPPAKPAPKGKAAAKAPPASATPAKATPPPVERDARLPRPGGVLTRTFQGKEIKVQVLDAGFGYEGKTWRSISAIAKAVTGTSWNGYLFFGLQTRAKQPTDSAPAAKDGAK